MTEPELAPGLLSGASPRPGITYRMLRVIWRASAWASRADLVLEGAENLPRDARGRPAGRWIAAVVPHRTWIDPAGSIPLPGKRKRGRFLTTLFR